MSAGSILRECLAATEPQYQATLLDSVRDMAKHQVLSVQVRGTRFTIYGHNTGVMFVRSGSSELTYGLRVAAEHPDTVSVFRVINQMKRDIALVPALVPAASMFRAIVRGVFDDASTQFRKLRLGERGYDTDLTAVKAAAEPRSDKLSEIQTTLRRAGFEIDGYSPTTYAYKGDSETLTKIDLYAGSVRVEFCDSPVYRRRFQEITAPVLLQIIELAKRLHKLEQAFVAESRRTRDQQEDAKEKLTKLLLGAGIDINKLGVQLVFHDDDWKLNDGSRL